MPTELRVNAVGDDRHRNARTPTSLARDQQFLTLCITPLEFPDVTLAHAVVRAGAAAALDIGRERDAWPALIAELGDAVAQFGLRIPDHVAFDPQTLPHSPAFAIVTTDNDIGGWRERCPVLVQVTSVEQARIALAAGVDGLIAKGQESGGAVGEDSSFILLQRVLALPETGATPVWCQGGIGLHTAAAAIAGGARGVALDAQLALLAESRLPAATRQLLRRLDGSEGAVAAGYRVHAPRARPKTSLPTEAGAIRARLGYAIERHLLPLGQDAALAPQLAAKHGNVESLLYALRTAIAGHIRQAQALLPLAEGAPLAAAHGTRYPIAQGPMTRVSDTACFAQAVADNGALPFLALSLMQADACRTLLETTRERLGAHGWGVGLLGFAKSGVLDPQLDLVREFKPDVVLLAGGRPAQAKPLQEAGITTYLHVPSPRLLQLFLDEGMRHFVLEGRECGGHVGPRFSFVLWEQQIEVLLGSGDIDALHILFAGGIHDDRSAAMVAALAAPLAALGAKIGILMGTAYIATREAVDKGAVLEDFQQLALAGADTVLIETGPGHAVRCLPSPFVGHFESARQRLLDNGVPPQEAWERLEALNAGRLRIATKGIERRKDALHPVPADDRRARGLYMIGQAIALRDDVTTMAQLHRAVSADAMQHLLNIEAPPVGAGPVAEPIAIIGMDCILPGSPDLDAYWANILAGRDLVTEIPAERWSAALHYRDDGTDGKSPSKWGGFIAPTAFDPLEFGIPPQSLAAIEPAQILSLLVARRALADAGYGDDAKPLDRNQVAVVVGAEAGMDLANAYRFRNLFAHYLGELPAELDTALPKLTEDSFPGVLANVIAGRIANRLGLGGPNYAVDSACASSLTAVELAVKELRAGGSDMALAVGADLHNSLHDFLMFASVGALSARGRCRSFDANADGICLGEGVGVIVLKRLADAQRDGDRIYAVIDGIAGSSDGRGLGLTAPRKEGQKRALERAWRQAGVLPADIGLVEAHGTGTVVGDRTELQTLTEAFVAGGALPAQAQLGSVKSQIGHTKCAAGIAGLIKIAKALHHQVLPPTALIDTPNAGYRAQTSPFTLDRLPRPWPAPAAHPLRAAVSAFGFGGANFHAVLSAPPAAAGTGSAQWDAELFLFRGADPATARRAIERLTAFLDGSDAPLALRDLACTAERIETGPVQCAFVARDRDELAAHLRAALADNAAPDIYRRSDADTGKIAFLYPGQGSQTPDMLLDLFVAFPPVRNLLAVDPACARLLFPPTVWDAGARAAQQHALTDTRNAQPALGMVELAATWLLHRLGLTPDMAAGHSYGELVALCCAGTFGPEELLQLSRRRGESILAGCGDDPGRMAAVGGETTRLRELLAVWPDIVLANQNSPTQTVISGPSQAIDAALGHLKAAGVAARPIPTACAFHSPVVGAAAPLFRAALDTVDVVPPTLPVYANTTAAIYPAEADAIRALLARHIASPVRFVEQIERMHADGARLFVEVGPRRVLSGLVRDILGDHPHRCIALEPAGKPGLSGILDAVAQLAVVGDPLNPAVLFAGRDAHPLDLDAPHRIAASAWLVDGSRARPRSGAVPASAGTVLTEPVALAPVATISNAALPGIAAPALGDEAVAGYLSNMREIARGQRDVLLALLGRQPAAAPSPSATPGDDGPPTLAEPAALYTLPVRNSPQDRTPATDVHAALLQLVSERTGYPADMLDADLDLEADLSIDSIKRVEIVGALGARLGLADDALLEQVSRLKTLRAIGERVAAHQRGEAIASPSTPVAQDARGTLIALVSERTGYPADMLDLDLDLEADLSIDSIKRVEIVAAFATRANLAALPGYDDALPERLSRLKTLRALIDALSAAPIVVANRPADTHPLRATPQGSMPSGGTTLGGTTQGGTTQGGTPLGGTPLARYHVEIADAPPASPDPTALQGRRLLITDDGLGVAAALAQKLKARGALVTVASFGEDDPLPALDDVDDLVHLWPLAPHHRVRDIKRFFRLAQDALQARARRLLVGTGLGGDFGRAADNTDFGRGAGLSGMIKSIAREYPDVRAQCVDLNLAEPAGALAAQLEFELLASNGLTEVGYRRGRRCRREFVETPLPAGDLARIGLSRDSVVLLTGGARGITGRLAVDLAQRFQCRLELIGRTPLPDAPEPALTAGAPDRHALRRALSGGPERLTTAEIEKRSSRILAEREMRATLDAIRSAGARVSYTQLDVRNIAAFAGHIGHLYERHGRIDGVVHGAGVIEDRLLRDKTEESFARVFDTKVRAALMLNKLLRADVRFVVFFSSVASAFGNRGQVDYASANDVLDQLAGTLQARIGGRVLSVNWGPWAETGMVSPHLEREYARTGIGLIPTRDGIAALMHELAEPRTEASPSQMVLMCGRPEHFDAAVAAPQPARRLA